MADKLLLEELQHVMGIMNGDCIYVDCPVCASARQKLAEMIIQVQEKPTKEVRDIGGHTVTVEHTKG